MNIIRRNARSFVKFGIVGGTGTILNLIVFWSLVDLLGANHNLGSVVAFCLAVTSNYYLNRHWTFRRELAGRGPTRTAYARYVAINIVGLGINLAVLNLYISLFDPPLYLVAQAIGIGAAMGFNFVFSKLFVFSGTSPNLHS